MMRDTGANTVGELATQIQTTDALAAQNQMQRVIRDQMNSQYQSDLQYQRNTDLLAQMNESYNTNKYIDTNLRNEQIRLSKMDGNARRDVYMYRKRILYAEYMTNYYRMMAGVLALSLFVTLLLLVPAAMWRADRLGFRTLIIVDAIVLTLFLAVLIFIFIRMGRRDVDDWKMRRWAPDATIRAKVAADQQR